MDISKLKKILRIEGEGQDEIVQDVLSASMSFIERYTGYKINIGEFEEKFIGSNSSFYFTSHAPLKSVISLYEDNEDITSKSSILDSMQGAVILKDGMFSEKYIYTIRYTAGFGHGLPSDIEWCIGAISTALYYSYEKIKDSVKSIGTADGTITYDDKIIKPDILNMLNRWKRVV